MIYGQKRQQMNKNILTKCKNSNIEQLSYDVLTKKKVAFQKNKGINIKYDFDLMKISQKSLSSQNNNFSRPS